MNLEQSFLANADRDEISKPLQYIRWYTDDLDVRRNEPLVIVEVGVYRGHFLAALETWFSKAHVVGIDLHDFRTVSLKRSSFHLADQTDGDALDRIFELEAPNGADIIIDDASHFGVNSLALFNATFDRWLRPDGYYYVEDWGTGFWPDWPDGSVCQGVRVEGHRIISHDCGMVGFVKALIDEVAAPDQRPPRRSRIASMVVRPGLVRLQKTGEGTAP